MPVLRRDALWHLFREIPEEATRPVSRISRSLSVTAVTAQMATNLPECDPGSALATPFELIPRALG